jgi:hypothetical protein
MARHYSTFAANKQRRPLQKESEMDQAYMPQHVFITNIDEVPKFSKKEWLCGFDGINEQLEDDARKMNKYSKPTRY